MMRKMPVRVLVASSVLSVTLLQSCAVKEGLEEPMKRTITVVDLLNSLNVPAHPDVISTYLAEAKRIVSFTGAPSGAFTRLVMLGRYRNLFRYERVDPLGPTKQIDVFDGYAVYHAMSANGISTEESQRPGDSPSETVGVEIRTFGLLPILARLIDPKTESVYEGRNAQGLDCLKVKVSSQAWTVYADSEHLIRRLEFHDSTIEYDDYRVVDDIRLPFKQRFFLRGKLYYELLFTKIDLKPGFPSDYFSHEAILKDVVR